MNMQTRVAVVVASAAMILSVAGPISARQPTASSTKEADSATAEALISKMVSTGASQKSIDRVLKARLGWVRSDVVDASVRPLSSTQTDAAVQLPTLYHSIPGKYWVATATFSWDRNCGTFGDAPCWYKDCPTQGHCGGPDGFGVRVNREVNESATYYYTYDEFGTSKQWIGPDDMNGFGATWTTSDTVNGSKFPSGVGEKYDWDHGRLYYYFNAISCTGLKGVAWKFYSRLNHTWNDTSITGFGVSVVGFSVATGGGSNYWPLSTSTPVNGYLCGV